MTWYGKIIKGIAGFFKPGTKERRVAPVEASDYRPLTVIEKISIGLNPLGRRYVRKSVKKVTGATPMISVRQYQTAQTGVSPEARAAQYKAKTRPKITRQSQQFRPQRMSHGRYLYIFEWIDDEGPRIPPLQLARFKSRAKVQVQALGETDKRYGEGGQQWRTIAVVNGSELEKVFERILDSGFAGFSAQNQPTKIAITIWKH